MASISCTVGQTVRGWNDGRMEDLESYVGKARLCVFFCLPIVDPFSGLEKFLVHVMLTVGFL